MAIEHNLQVNRTRVREITEELQQLGEPKNLNRLIGILAALRKEDGDGVIASFLVAMLDVYDKAFVGILIREIEHKFDSEFSQTAIATGAILLYMR